MKTKLILIIILSLLSTNLYANYRRAVKGAKPRKAHRRYRIIRLGSVKPNIIDIRQIEPKRWKVYPNNRPIIRIGE